MKKLVSSLFLGLLLMSVSTFATEGNTTSKKNVKSENIEFSQAYETLSYFSENYTELGHYQNAEKLKSLSEKYSAGSELSFARAFRNEQEVVVFMMEKSGSALVVRTEVKKDEGPNCDCFYDGRVFDPELPFNDPFQCSQACDQPGPGGKK